MEESYYIYIAIAVIVILISIIISSSMFSGSESQKKETAIMELKQVSQSDIQNLQGIDKIQMSSVPLQMSHGPIVMSEKQQNRKDIIDEK